MKPMELKDKIKELRIKNCLTQDQLAEKLCVSRQTISKYELGINEPSIEILKAMCEIFDCDFNELINVNKEDPKILKHERIKRILFYTNIILIAFSFFVVFVFIRFLPEEIPMHYDENFVPDRIGSKYELLFVLALMILPIIVILSTRLIRNDLLIEQKKYDVGLVTSIIALVVEIVFLVVMIVICSISLKEPMKYIHNILTSIFGGVFIVLSLLSSPLFNDKINPFFGYRTRFSLANRRNRILLNTCQSIGGAFCSIVVIVLGMTIVTDMSYLFLLIILLSLLITFIFEYILKIKSKKTIR